MYAAQMLKVEFATICPSARLIRIRLSSAFEVGGGEI
jgi:hypothetical protein